MITILQRFFYFSDSYTRITFPIEEKTKIKDVGTNVTENVTKSVTEKRSTQIIDLILNNPSITTKQIAELLKVSKRTIIRDIDKLKNKGKIEYKGPARGGYWKIKAMP